MGVATQCLKSSKCFRAKAQYYANVCLKINVKLGGINAIPDPKSVKVLSDPQNPTIVMGVFLLHSSFCYKSQCFLFMFFPSSLHFLNSYVTDSPSMKLSSTLGADVIHPAPGSDGRPSFTSLVASVDSDNAKYVAECGVQTSRQEIIENLEVMAVVCVFLLVLFLVSFPFFFCGLIGVDRC